MMIQYQANVSQHLIPNTSKNRVLSSVSIYLKCDSILDAQFLQNSTHCNIHGWPAFYTLEEILQEYTQFKTRLQKHLYNEEHTA